jgi:hypothetical protein
MRISVRSVDGSTHSVHGAFTVWLDAPLTHATQNRPAVIEALETHGSATDTARFANLFEAVLQAGQATTGRLELVFALESPGAQPVDVQLTRTRRKAGEEAVYRIAVHSQAGGLTVHTEVQVASPLPVLWLAGLAQSGAPELPEACVSRIAEMLQSDPRVAAYCISAHCAAGASAFAGSQPVSIMSSAFGA